jgi:hypothetical protein
MSGVSPEKPQILRLEHLTLTGVLAAGTDIVIYCGKHNYLFLITVQVYCFNGHG